MTWIYTGATDSSFAQEVDMPANMNSDQWMQTDQLFEPTPDTMVQPARKDSVEAFDISSIFDSKALDDDTTEKPTGLAIQGINEQKKNLTTTHSNDSSDGLTPSSKPNSFNQGASAMAAPYDSISQRRGQIGLRALTLDRNYSQFHDQRNSTHLGPHALTDITHQGLNSQELPLNLGLHSAHSSDLDLSIASPTYAPPMVSTPGTIGGPEMFHSGPIQTKPDDRQPWLVETSRSIAARHFQQRLTPPPSAKFTFRTSLSDEVLPKRHARKQSISKMPLSELFGFMGLSHDHAEAKIREARIMEIVRREGFRIGEQTWIRDTEESCRRRIIDVLYAETFEEYGYNRQILETIVRRGTYARMQSRLRKFRRNRKVEYGQQGC